MAMAVGAISIGSASIVVVLGLVLGIDCFGREVLWGNNSVPRR